MVRSIHILLLVLIALSAGLPAGMQATPSGWYIVTSTNDSGPGSLRQAIIDANAVPGSDTIDFNIPRSDPGYSSSDDVWTIRPTSLLPSLTGGDMTIRGWTQGENQGDSNGYYPNVRIDGSGLAANAWIFSVESNFNVINELMINYAPGTGIKLISGAAENNITRNFIGIGPDGSSPAGNGTGIEIFGGANDNWIHDNIIGFNERHGIMIAGSGTDNNFIANNWIGLGWNGEARPNGEHGILIMNGASGNGVGSGSWA